jgi:hypothetical protein
VGDHEAALAFVYPRDHASAADYARRPVTPVASAEGVNEDYRDILSALVAHEARFLIVGAHALAVHGYPRATVDIDIWIDATPENAHRVWRALAEFGAPLGDLGVHEKDLTRPNVVAQFGLPRIPQ